MTEIKKPKLCINKFVSILVVMCLVTIVPGGLSTQKVYAATNESFFETSENADGTVTTTDDDTKSGSNVEIPEKIEGKTVTEINGEGNNADGTVTITDDDTKGGSNVKIPETIEDNPVTETNSAGDNEASIVPKEVTQKAPSIPDLSPAMYLTSEDYINEDGEENSDNDLGEETINYEGAAQVNECNIDDATSIPLNENVTTIQSGKTYTIENKTQLERFATLVNGGQNCEGATIQLTADIVLNENEVSNWESWASEAPANAWTSIGRDSFKPFKGIFDGDGHSISGIYINNEYGRYQGLFGYVDGGTIKNVSVTKSYIKASNEVGGVVGCCENNVEIKNCHNTGSIHGLEGEVGGIVGYCDNIVEITNCYNAGSVIAGINIGGIVGCFDSGKIISCYNAGSVSVDDEFCGQCGGGQCGGIVGYIKSSEITNCYNAGSVSGSELVGGVAGCFDNNAQIINATTISRCVQKVELMVKIRKVPSAN